MRSSSLCNSGNIPKAVAELISFFKNEKDDLLGKLKSFSAVGPLKKIKAETNQGNKYLLLFS